MLPDSKPLSPPPSDARTSALRPARRQLIVLAVILAIGAAVFVLLFVRPPRLGQEPPLPGPEVLAPEPSSEPAAPEGELAPLPPPYTVEAGDSLLDLADRFGTSSAALAAINDLDDPDHLTIGQVLTVPPSQSTLQPANPDTLLRELAATYQVDAETLAVYNGLPPERIDTPLGRTVVLVPERIGAPAPDTEIEAAHGVTYTVAEGDTLLSIAVELGVDPETIVAANGLDDADHILIGQELRIPTTD